MAKHKKGPLLPQPPAGMHWDVDEVDDIWTYMVTLQPHDIEGYTDNPFGFWFRRIVAPSMIRRARAKARRKQLIRLANTQSSHP